MSARLIIADSGGTSRIINRLAVADSGGTSRFIKRLFVADSGGTGRLVFQPALLDATMTEGAYSDGGIVLNGYQESGFGSMSNVTLSDGKILRGAYDQISPTNYGIVTVRGFSSNPGQSYLSSVTIGGVNKTTASVFLYSYDSGSGYATWQWSTLFGLDGTGTSQVRLIQ